MLIESLFLAALAATWLILFYHIILTFGAYKHFVNTLTSSTADQTLTQYPLVSILIPAHNEAMVIGRTVDAMSRLVYPKDKLQIVVVNDCSTDETGKILAEKCLLCPELEVLTLEKPQGAKGKANALNNGHKLCRGEYIVVYDADNTPERRALLYLVSTITQNPSYGAVVGKFRTRNKYVNFLTRCVNIETLSFQWLLQASRCHLFGLATIPGTNFIIRRSLLDLMNGWNLDALTEDTELTIRIYDHGYQIFWLPHAVTWEQEPETLGVWLKQRTRWAQGNMWIIWQYFWKMLGLKSYKIAADIIYFTFVYFVFFVAVIVSDIIFVLGIFDLYKINIDGPFFIIWLLAYALFIAQTFISLSLERGESTGENLFITAIMYFTYSQLWILLVFRAGYLIVKRYLSKNKELRWYKTERSSR